MSALPHLIFDFGAVVFRWRPVQFLRQTLPDRVPDDAAAEALARDFFQGYGGDWVQFDAGLIEVPELVQRIAARTGLAAAEVQRVVDGVPHELAPMAETVELLHRLKHAGHRLYYLSNMPAPYADHLEAAHDFLGCFDDGVFSARVKLAKPDAAIFEHALERFQVSAVDCIFIDDHPANVETARRLGLRAVLFEQTAQAAAELRAMGIAAA